jgi:hypothetical protein
MALDPSLIARAEALRSLDEKVSASARTADHAALAEQFATDRLALVAPYEEAIERLRARDASDLDLVLTYLETRPDFLGSEYLAARIIRALAKLEPEQLDRARVDAVLATIASAPRSEAQRAAASLVQRLAAGSPRRAPRVLPKKEGPAKRRREPAATEPEDATPHVIKVKGRAI